MITLQWKEFDIKLDRMNRYLKDNCINYDGMIADEDVLKITFYSEETQQDTDLVNNYWNSLTENNENTPNSYEIKKQYEVIISNAIDFGKKLSIDFASDNVIGGITQAGKTKDVALYLRDLSYYLTTGSLYEAINEINILISDVVPEGLSPFVTESILQTFKQKIEDYLGI